jgi:hypothetical protein
MDARSGVVPAAGGGEGKIQDGEPTRGRTKGEDRDGSEYVTGPSMVRTGIGPEADLSRRVPRIYNYQDPFLDSSRGLPLS